MNISKLALSSLTSVAIASASISAFANQVQLIVNHPTNVTYRLAYKNIGGDVVWGQDVTTQISSSTNILIDTKQYALSGLVVTAVNGHHLPPQITQFDVPQTCGMTTNALHPSGSVDLKVTEHAISCRTIGGVYGK